MTDIFSQEGIDFQSASMASSHPTDAPAPIKAPHVSIPSNTAPDTAVDTLPTGSPVADKGATVTSLFGSDVPTGDFKATLTAANGQSKPLEAPSAPRDIFEAEGIDAPTIGEANSNAFNNGVALPDIQEADRLAALKLNSDAQTAQGAPQRDGGADPLATDQAQPVDSWKPMSRAAMSMPPGLQQPQQEVEAHAAMDMATVMKIAETRFSPDQIAAMKDNPITFREAFSKLHPNQILPGGGFSQLAGSLEIADIAKRAQKGEDITPADKEKMASFLDEQIEQRIRGFSWGGNVAYVGSQIPAFVVEFALSDGFGKGAQVAATKGAEKYVASQALQKSAGIAARVATTTSLMPAQVAEKYGERRVNDIMTVTDKGEAVLKDSEESPAQSALLAFSHTSADAAAQIAAPGIGKYLVNPVTRRITTPLIAAVNELPAPAKLAIYNAYKTIQPNAQVSKVFTAAGWAGMIEQLGANRVADILHSSIDYGTDKNVSFDQYLDRLTPSKDQLLVEGGLIGIAGGIHTGSSVAFNIMRGKGLSAKEASETVDNMSAIERESYVNDNLEMPKSEFPPSSRPDIPLESPPESMVASAALPSGAPTKAAPKPNAVPDSMEADVVKSQIESVQAKEPPPIHDEESTFNNLYRAMVNEHQPIHDLVDLVKERGIELEPMQNPKLLSSVYSQNVEIIRENLQTHTSTWGPDGNRVITGKSLKAISDDFDNYFIAKEPSREARAVDFDTYLKAERFLEVLKDDKGEYTRVTEKQQMESVAGLARLADKYGDDYRMIHQLAGEVYQFQDRIVQNLVDSGVMSKDMLDTLRNKYTKYVPLQRVMEDKGISDAVMKGPFTDAKKETVIKRLRGSEKEVKPIMESIISNTAKILDLAARNKVAQSVADLAEHLPEYIQREKTPIVKKGTAEVKVTYDPKLREKLDKTIEFLGGRLETNKSVKVKGYKGVLGSYSPAEKLVRVKLGAGESVKAHEVGHMLDFELGLKKRMLTEKGVREELQKLAEDRLGAEQELVHDGDAVRFKEQLATDSTPEKYLEYIRNDHEILANFFDAYVNSPEQLAKIAPKALKSFEKVIDENPQLEFLRDVKRSTSVQEETITKDVYGEADFAPPKTITVYRDGKREYYRVAQPLLEAMAKLGPAKMNLAEKILAAPFRFTAALLRSGATLTPEFAIRNVLRDQQDAFLQSGVRYTPDHFVRGLFSAISKDDLYHQWAASGGKFSSYMSLDDKGLQHAYKELFNKDGKLARYLKNPIHLIEDIAQTGEQATRVGVFNAAKKAGQSDIEAAYASLEATLNFARGGSVGKKINKYIPFFNAGIQGSDKMIRTFKNNPKALTFWGVATITVPSIMLTGYYLYGANEEDRKEFLEIPQWQRDMFWVAKVDGEWVRYPKPFTYGYIFGSIPERIMQWMYDGDKPQGEEAWKGIVKGLAGSVSPINDSSSVLPPLLKTAIEDTTNYNFFTGRNIYPDWMDRLEPEQRSNKYTSDTAKGIGHALSASPAKIENTVQGLAGGAGKYALQAGDKILDEVKKWNGEEIPQKPTTGADMPLIKAFAMRNPVGYNSNSAAGFFKNFEEVSQKRATYKKLEGDEKAHYIEANREYIQRFGLMNGAYKQIRAEQKAIDKIYDHPSMDSKDKVAEINTHAEAITRIAREANKQYNAAKNQR